MLDKMKSAALLGSLMLVLAGCSGDPAPETEPTTETATTAAAETATPVPSAEPTESAEALEQLAAGDLTELFTTVQFPPGEYATTGEMIDSIYPGLTASDVTCLTPFGLGWDEDPALADSTLEFGTSNDRSMTAVIASTGSEDTASTLVADAQEAIERCPGDGALFEMQGVEVETQVEETTPTLTGADEAIGWQVTGDVGGAPFSLVGITARVGGNTIALVGWDPATNESYVPQATQMFVDDL